VALKPEKRSGVVGFAVIATLVFAAAVVI